MQVPIEEVFIGYTVV